MQLLQLLPQLSRAHIVRGWDHDLDLHDFVPALFFARGRRYAFLAQPQLLPALRSWRDLQLRPPVDRGHFNLGSQCGFPGRHRNCDVNVITFAAKNRMVAHADDDIKIACRSAVRSGVALAGQANALPVACARFYADFQRFSALHCAFTVAHRAGRLHLTAAAGPGTHDVELHPAAGLRDLAAAVALRACGGSSHHAAAVAVCAGIKARDVQAHDRSADRIPETDVDLVLKVGAAFRSGFRGRAAPSAKDAGENIAESARSLPAAGAAEIGEIEPAEIEALTPAARPSAPGRPGAEPACAKSAAARICLRRRGIDIV